MLTQKTGKRAGLEGLLAVVWLYAASLWVGVWALPAARGKAYRLQDLLKTIAIG